MNDLIAQQEYPIGEELEGFGNYGLEGRNPAQAGSIFNEFISNIIGILTLIAGVWFFFVLITGAIAWISAGGDKGKVAEARQRITMGLVGIAVVVAAIFIVDIVGNLLGFPQILDPASLIQTLSP
ncbi:MAG: hypothetical protein PVJ52_03095 [Candidatus Woesebacteria bacterium]|jgi:hypothetical protein